eukprot:TRINITY_DN24425_c0_g1_i1.p1 TRINITY_DN24425_c0_g1~~TRINITY_DN24425_c0_g1_i1.p1  ORF type:complete len:661 (+),score=107.22 TRINITY_DN24425_c0_g1_i1:120-2102(+)
MDSATSEYASRGDIAACDTLDVGIDSVVAPVSGMLHVKACGRIFCVDAIAARSLMELQGEVQRTLQMDGQDFQFFDGMGKPITTDMSLREAVRKGITPLGASLSDASIHFMENRREELAQMQWKLVREKMHGCMADVQEVSRQFDEFRLQCQLQTSENQVALEQMKAETLQAIDHERRSQETNFRQVSERVTGIGLMITNEQNKRESTMQTVDQQFHEVRALMDAEASSRHEELAAHMSMIQDGRSVLENHKRIYEAFIAKHDRDLELVRSEIDNSQCMTTKNMEDQVDSLKKALDDVGYKVRLHESQIQGKLAEAEATANAATRRTSELEAWCGTLEERIRELVAVQAARLDSLAERQEHNRQHIESVRLEEKKHFRELETNLERLKHMEDKLPAIEDEIRVQAQKQNEKRCEDLQRVQVVLRGEVVKQIADLEQKTVGRLALESNIRERGTKGIYEELHKLLNIEDTIAGGFVNKTHVDSPGTTVDSAPNGLSTIRFALPPQERQPLQRAAVGSLSSTSSLCSQLSRAGSPRRIGSSISVPSFHGQATVSAVASPSSAMSARGCSPTAPCVTGLRDAASCSATRQASAQARYATCTAPVASSMTACASKRSGSATARSSTDIATPRALGGVRQVSMKPGGTAAPPPRHGTVVQPGQWM